ncbi:MAG: decaprenyl-phosphate phosphoribosyltransferase [Candidatus Aminicenantes bacterium]|nr:decaprenyl-phosphate phosphoribosyltransferase [Candidatus Aminicenantes bacterium]
MELFAIVKTLRPPQWIKNLFIFAALIFAQRFDDIDLFIKTSLAFFVFCLLSGAVYIINDILDVEEDKLHPKKSKRPIASGVLGRGQALTAFFVLAGISLAAAFFLSVHFFIISLGYCLLQIAYSLKLKHIVILDVFIIAAGFVIRVVAGGLVIDVPISSWLLICTMLLALFLAMSKRRHELVILETDAMGHRPILKEYSTHLLDQMIAVVTASTLIAYCLYTISEETVEKFGTTYLVLTSPFVLYGIFRYLYLVHQKEKGGSPEELILHDKPLLVDIILWIISIIVIIYFT